MEKDETIKAYSVPIHSYDIVNKNGRIFPGRRVKIDELAKADAEIFKEYEKPTFSIRALGEGNYTDTIPKDLDGQIKLCFEKIFSAVDEISNMKEETCIDIAKKYIDLKRSENTYTVEEFEREFYKIEGIPIYLRKVKFAIVPKYHYRKRLSNDNNIANLVKRVNSCLGGEIETSITQYLGLGLFVRDLRAMVSPNKKMYDDIYGDIVFEAEKEQLPKYNKKEKRK